MTGDGTEATVELTVGMTCGKCEAAVSRALESAGVKDYSVDLEKQKVLVTSSLSAETVKDVVEQTGRTAVLVGAGSLGAAVAMVGLDGDYYSEGAKGVIRLTQVDRERCVIEGVVDGLTPGAHGLAIHETGDVSRGCASLGGHFNPRGTRHGSPEFNADKRHVGDLGNVTAGEDGRASFRLTDKLVKVWDVIGRSVVVASKPDDLGLGSAPSSPLDGNCGTGVACGIIARSAGLGENTKKICACDGVTIWDERNRPAAGPGRRA